MKVMITGHRPKKLGGYQINPTQTKIKTWLTKVILSGREKYDNFEIISGMALGVDQWWAESAIETNTPFHAYIPFEGQESHWPKSSQETYHKILSAAYSKVIVSPDPGSRWARAMQIRNEAMVNDADFCVAIWNGEESGGTWNCIDYIRTAAKDLLIYNVATNQKHWERNGQFVNTYSI